jgi:hypothetical protein
MGIAAPEIGVRLERTIEKGQQVGIAVSYCVWLISLGNAVQKGTDLIGGNWINLTITELLKKPINDALIRLYLFFSSA